MFFKHWITVILFLSKIILAIKSFFYSELTLFKSVYVFFCIVLIRFNLVLFSVKILFFSFSHVNQKQKYFQFAGCIFIFFDSFVFFYFCGNFKLLFISLPKKLIKKPKFYYKNFFLLIHKYIYF